MQSFKPTEHVATELQTISRMLALFSNSHFPPTSQLPTEDIFPYDYLSNRLWLWCLACRSRWLKDTQRTCIYYVCGACICSCGYTWTCVYVDVEVIGWHWVSFSRYCPPSVLRQIFHRTWNSQIQRLVVHQTPVISQCWDHRHTSTCLAFSQGCSESKLWS